MMKNKILIKGIEIDYDDNLIEKIKKSTGKKDISESDIVQFFIDSIGGAIEKKYGIIEEQ